MVSTPRDNNRVPTLLATLSTDGVTVKPVRVQANHSLCTSDGTTGSSFASTSADRDDNRVTALWGVSSVDGITPTAIYCDSNGSILIQTT